jgi:hypothetical protein
MAKEAKKKTADGRKTATKDDPKAGQERRHPVRSFLKSVVLLTFIGASVYGYLRARDHVVKEVTFPRFPPKVVLKDRPSWMSDALAAKIIRVAAPDVAHSAFDHQLLVNTAAILRNHSDTAPWVKNVKAVRRAFENAPGDLMEIECEFRSPVGLVKWENYYWLIDGDGILLPEQYIKADLDKVMRDGDRVVLRIIEGAAAAPPQSGQRWPGQDVAAGIDMIKLLYGKPYADEVERINVANFGGRQDRSEAQLVLVTKYDTQLLWGRPINAKDYIVEVTPAQKLEYMSMIVAQYGRVDAKHAAVDLRFDTVYLRNDPTQARGDQAASSDDH